MGWDACVYEKSDILRWIECHPALGAYATLLAVLATIWSTRLLISEERKRTEARGRVIAMRLAPVLAMIRADIERVKYCADLLRKPEPNMIQIRTLINGLAIPTLLPEDIFSETWTMPPRIALVVANLETALRTYDTLVTDISQSTFEGWPSSEKAKYIDGQNAILMQIDACCAEAYEYANGVAQSAIAPLWRRWINKVWKLKTQ